FERRIAVLVLRKPQSLQRPRSIAMIASIAEEGLARARQTRARETGIERLNISETERWVSTLGGGALALYGLGRGSLPGLGLAAMGAALVYRGVTGHCD